MERYAPHKAERRDEGFDKKMVTILAVYRVVMISSEEKVEARKKITVSYDDKPGIQAMKNISAQLLPLPGKYAGIGRDYEYKRLGTVTLMAARDLHTGIIIPMVKDRHRSAEFIEFLKPLDNKYALEWIIRIVLDNHGAHKSKETLKYLKTKPGRFEMVFTPTHGSWLNMIEMLFSKIARGFLRDIRVQTKKELIDRIYLGIEELNKEPVIFKWKYKMDEIQTV
ncbi:MAG: IS630 family transposase [Chitinophagaceae bacterium]